MRMPVISCFLAAICIGFSYPLSIKSESINTIAFFFITLLRNCKASPILVLKLLGSNSISSLMMRSTWDLPFLGGINNSIWSEKSIKPVLSLFCNAENAKVAAISVIISLLNCCCVPKSSLPLTSTISIRVSSRSSSNTFTKGSL